MSDRLAGWPGFVRELDRTLTVHAQFVLHGNIRDRYAPGPAAALVDLTDLLWRALEPSGYQALLRFDPVTAQVDLVHRTGLVDTNRIAGGRLPSGPVPLDDLRPVLSAVCGPGEPDRPRALFVIDYASRIVRTPGQLSDDERNFFRFCQKLAHDARPGPGGPSGRPGQLHNPLIWLADGERDLPAWLTAGTDRIRVIAVPRPDAESRLATATMIAGAFGIRQPTTEQRRRIDALAAACDGLPTLSMLEIMRLAFDNEIPFDRIDDAVRLFQVGVADNPWKSPLLRRRIREAEREIPTKVLGQPQAVTKTFDILKRSALGLSGAQAASSGRRPRGVLFFAGPTGVGKTELAKQVAQTIFGDTEAMLRFDMSEFAAEHAADRLAGAPPGYVGFEAGGELTSAVREQPFRVLLFDEIEKAHQGVLDKFLQILDDGRLTDGQGMTTYFSDCVLIFTSNLGVGAAASGTPYPELEKAIRGAVKAHFTDKLGRPELLNRIGDNIVVFGYITPEIARKIVDLQADHIVSRLHREQQIALDLSDDARAQLKVRAVEDEVLAMGGRGIGNEAESMLVNPLARELFELAGDGPLPERARVDQISRLPDGQVSLTLSTPRTGFDKAAGPR